MTTGSPDLPRPPLGSPYFQRLRAYAVHVFTASGLVFDFAAALVLCSPQPDVRRVFLLLLIPVLVDAVDGPLARRWDVKRWAGDIDGRTIDDIADFATFTFVPLLLIWRMGWLPWPAPAYLAVALVASVLGFAHREAKQEEDGFFRGFPSYWNVYAFYAGLWATRYGTGFVAAGCLILSVLTVSPIRLLYPNRAPRPWRGPLLVGGAIWTATLLAMLPTYPNPKAPLALFSLVYPIFYLALSATLDLRSRRP